MEVFNKYFDFNYEVSNFGNVRNMKTKQILKPQLGKVGYYVVSLRKDNKHHTMYIHQLVYKSINGDYDTSLYCIDHIDRNKLNNNIENLRLGSYSYNNYNVVKRVTSTSQYKGVSWCNIKKRWRCSIIINSKQINKYFKEEIDCALHYNFLVDKNNLAEFVVKNEIVDK